jgi:nucleoside-diphosphate-sugar epimerase
LRLPRTRRTPGASSVEGVVVRLLVLGGTVFLSSAVAAEAVRRGHDVTCVARGESGRFPAGVRAVRGDRTDPAVLGALADGRWDAVVDVARRPSYVAGAVDRLAPVAGTYVFVSSSSVYRDTATVGADESGALHDPLTEGLDEADPQHYASAKVSCEQLVSAAFPGRSLLCRAGLVVGPGDPTDRFGWWPIVLAAGGDVLAPEPRDGLVQVVDVRDLGAWLVDAAESGLVGTYDAVGPVVPLAAALAEVGGAVGGGARLVWADAAWLLAQGVQPWAGPESLPLWVGGDPAWAGVLARSGAAARAAGLRTRPLAATSADVLEDERRRGLERPRRAGLTAARHRELLAAWRARAASPSSTG